MRRLLAGSLLTLAVVSTPHPGQAQASGVGFAALSDGDVLAGFNGPWRPGADTLDITYRVACIDLNNPQIKKIATVIAAVPNGSTLAQLREVVTDAVIAGCDSEGVTIGSPNAVFLPAVTQGL